MFCLEPTICGQEPGKEGALLYGDVMNLRAELRDIGDAEVTAIRLSFKMEVHNDGARAVQLGDSSYLTFSVQFRKRGVKEWQQLTRNSLYYYDSLECSSCSLLASGAVRKIEKVESQITTLKRLWPDPAQVEFRLLLEAICRQRGRLHSEVFVTAPFHIDLKEEK